MRNVLWILVALAALAFVLAVVAALMGQPLFRVSAEGFSRACTNLTVIAIALKLLGSK
jgi:hypothetical protein